MTIYIQYKVWLWELIKCLLRYAELAQFLNRPHRIHDYRTYSSASPQAIITDFSSDAGVPAQCVNFTYESESWFLDKLNETIPPETSTRVILLLMERKDLSSMIFNSTTVEILGSVYKVPPSFFYVFQRSEANFRLSQNLDEFEPHLRVGYDYGENSGISFTATCLRNEGRKIGLLNSFFCEAFSQNWRIIVVAIYQCPFIRNELLWLRINPTKAESCTGPIFRIWENLTSSEIESASQNYLELLIPIIRDMGVFFLQDVEDMDCDLQSWLEGLDSNVPAQSRATGDEFLLISWHKVRGALEDFERIISSIEEYQEKMIAQGTIEHGHNDNQKIKNMIQRYRKSLHYARRLEQHVRDTLQMNVGNLSLKESRKSIEQAKSLGRLSVLAFIFLPISLVTSFFGMNISEMTGNGASWKTFLIVAGTLCSLGVLTFLWLFRKAPRVGILLSLCFYPLVWSLHWVNEHTFESRSLHNSFYSFFHSFGEQKMAIFGVNRD